MYTAGCTIVGTGCSTGAFKLDDDVNHLHIIITPAPAWWLHQTHHEGCMKFVAEALLLQIKVRCKQVACTHHMHAYKKGSEGSEDAQEEKRK
jgi:hypothetical protein